MKVWLINQYNSLPEHGQFTRNYYLAKGLSSLGHEPIVFAGSNPHNTSIQLIDGSAIKLVSHDHGFPFVYIRTGVYGCSRIRQILEMIRFYYNTWKVTQKMETPDVIIGSSAHPLAALLAIRLGKKFRSKKIVEIRDLWPESMVAHGILSKNNPITKALYAFERHLYKQADAIIFTMPGGANYIKEQGWDSDSGGVIDLKKVYHINNGVDLYEFNQNRAEYPVQDPDLQDDLHFKLVYAGTLGLANNMDLLIDTAKLLEDTRVKFLIWGTGSELERLQRRCFTENVSNVVFKGPVRKNLVPSILSQADATFFVLKNTSLYRFGLSLNKSFEYFAAGKPTMIVGRAAYSLVDEFKCGLHVQEATAAAMSEGIRKFLTMNEVQYDILSSNALKAAKAFDYVTLSKKLEKLIEEDE